METYVDLDEFEMVKKEFISALAVRLREEWEQDKEGRNFDRVVEEKIGEILNKLL